MNKLLNTYPLDMFVITEFEYILVSKLIEALGIEDKLDIFEYDEPDVGDYYFVEDHCCEPSYEGLKRLRKECGSNKNIIKLLHNNMNEYKAIKELFKKHDKYLKEIEKLNND